MPDNDSDNCTENEITSTLAHYLPTFPPTPKLNRKPAALSATSVIVAPNTNPATIAGVESITPMASLAIPLIGFTRAPLFITCCACSVGWSATEFQAAISIHHLL